MKNTNQKKLLRMRPDLEIVSYDDLVCPVLVLIYYDGRVSNR